MGLCLAGAAVSFTVVLMAWPGIRSPYEANGYIAGLQALYPMIGGFFVAALTLLSTASTTALSQPLNSTPPITFGRETAPLDRRRFLCLLFGYLSFSSFALYAVGFIVSLLAPGARQLTPIWLHTPVSALFLLAYNFWLAHMFISTMVGLYYFTDRLQRPDPELVRDKP